MPRDSSSPRSVRGRRDRSVDRGHRYRDESRSRSRSRSRYYHNYRRRRDDSRSPALDISGSMQRRNFEMGVRGVPAEQPKNTNYLRNIKGAALAHASCDGPGSAGHRFLRSVIDKTLQRRGQKGDYDLALKKRARPSPKGQFFGSFSGNIAPQRARAIEAAFDRSTSPEPRPTGLKSNIVCRACMRPGHSVRDCIWTDSQHGDIQACPFCETFGLHLPEDCPERSSFGRADTWDLFVVRRGGKSQVRTGNNDLLWSHLVYFRSLDYPDEEQLTLYPHSLQFAVERLLANTERWRAHDYNAEPLSLVADPRTDGRDKILADDGLFVLSGAIPISN